ncbi:hypothetical protein [Nocardia rhizosphaerae]|uniref:DDE superfamily endonuclease n=1 Tax=Nocardia rhizosphaerae TaxID=1691571 RepID=A0ABV8LAH2_9NOCA
MLGDKGYQGAQGVLTRYKGRGKPDAQKIANLAMLGFVGGANRS